MVGYIIGIILGVCIFLFQNLKPTSGWFRILYLVASIAFIIGMYFAGMGYWNIILIPIGEAVLAFISACIFPCSLYEPTEEEMAKLKQIFCKSTKNDLK